MKVWLLFIGLWGCLIGFSAENLTQKVADLYAVNPAAQDQKEMVQLIQKHCENLKKYDRLTPKKRVKKIFQATQKRFLYSYSLYSFFPDIYESGTYNCVTGSALFALIFDELEIPYSVVEIPRHVYLVAYPETAKIGVESTVQEGVYLWNSYSKMQIINYLINAGKTTAEEVKFKGVEAIIATFFYTNDELDFSNLVGLHHFNRSLYYVDQKEMVAALASAKTGKQFYANEQSHYLIGACLSTLIRETSIENIAITDYLTQYYALTQRKPERERIDGTFKYVFQEAISTRRDTIFTDSAVYYIKQNLYHTADQNLFLSNVELITASWLISRGENELALNAAKRGYVYNPKNYQFEDMITALIIEETIEKEPDSKTFSDSLKTYEQHYPFVFKNKNFAQLALLFYAYGVTDHFLANENTEGFALLTELDLLLTRCKPAHYKDINKDIAEAYGEVAAYHFRQKEYERAMEWIEKALKLDPKSDRLNRKQDYIQQKIR